jgi:hypothetical protein
LHSHSDRLSRRVAPDDKVQVTFRSVQNGVTRDEICYTPWRKAVSVDAEAPTQEDYPALSDKRAQGMCAQHGEKEG